MDGLNDEVILRLLHGGWAEVNREGHCTQGQRVATPSSGEVGGGRVARTRREAGAWTVWGQMVPGPGRNVRDSTLHPAARAAFKGLSKSMTRSDSNL